MAVLRPYVAYRLAVTAAHAAAVGAGILRGRAARRRAESGGEEPKLGRDAVIAAGALAAAQVPGWMARTEGAAAHVTARFFLGVDPSATTIPTPNPNGTGREVEAYTALRRGNRRALPWEVAKHVGTMTAAYKAGKIIGAKPVPPR